MTRHARSTARAALWAAILALASAPLGCAPPSGAHEALGAGRGVGIVPPGRDGERGHGVFRTAWGVEELDYEWRAGRRVYEGDLVLDEDAQELAPSAEGVAAEAILSRAGSRWAMGASGVVTIPYEIVNTGGVAAATFDRTEGHIRRAMDHWETYARRPGGGQLLRFVRHAGESRYAQFQVKPNGRVCYVNLTTSGRTRIDSDPACGWQTYVHEIGHVLTFRHEQKRTDRDAYVIFHPERTTYDSEFAVVGGNLLGTTYDSDSIMHYPSCTFARSSCSSSTPGAWVLERRRAPRYIAYWSSRSVGEVLSPTDVCGLRTLYDLSCGGGGGPVPEDDAGTPTLDAGAPTVRDAGTVSDAGVPTADAGTPPVGGIAFPVTTGFAGMLQRVTTGECAVGGAVGGEVVLAACDELDAAHRWGATGTAALRNEGSAACAEPAGGTIAGAMVEARACSTEDLQRWRFGDVELVNGSSGTCLHVPGNDYFEGQHLVHRVCSGATNQRFTLVPETHQLLAQGFCLTAGETAGDRVELRACDGSALQQWIETNGGLAAGGHCMRIRGGAGAAPGAVIEATDCNGLVGQMWGLRGRIAHFDDALCLSPPPGAGAGTGAALELVECASSEEMIWWPRAACAPLSCEGVGASCGSFDDGCGGALECGECSLEPIGDAGVGEIEECVPLSCADLGASACGWRSDGCGSEVHCGPCADGCGCRAAGSGGRGGAGTAGVVATLVLGWVARRARRAGARRR